MEFNNEYWMHMALKMAEKAFEQNEVPVGAIIVRENQVIAKAWNQIELLGDATAHAEMLALTIAQEATGDWRLSDCTLFVTKEPCPMCAGALVHCRLKRVVFGAKDSRGGAGGSWINLLQASPALNHQCEVLSGILENESMNLLQSFFQRARIKKKEENPNPCQ